MISTSPATPADPTLAALVPMPSRRRDAVVAAVAVLAVVAAGWLGTVAALSATPRMSGATIVAGGRIAYVAELAVPQAPGITVAAVRAPVGSTLEGFWVLGAGDPMLNDGAVDPETLTAALAADPTRPHLPPQRATAGTLQVAMLLRIDDCAVFATDPAVADDAFDDGLPLTAKPVMVLRSFLGTTAEVPLSWSPWALQDLTDYGACG